MDFNGTEKVMRGVLVFLFNKSGKIGLALKKKKIGAGKLNGYGGGLKNLETEREAASRELYEETSGSVTLSKRKLEFVATIRFHNRLSSGKICICSIDVFFVHETGDEVEVQESDEMGPLEWYDVEHIPYKKMMIGDQVWLPRVLNRPRNTIISGDVYYAPEMKSLDRKSEFRTIKLSREA